MDIHNSLQARNLTDIVDVVFVSDHGMTDTSSPELIYIDDILGDGFNMIEHEDGASLIPIKRPTQSDPCVALRLAIHGPALQARSRLR